MKILTCNGILEGIGRFALPLIVGLLCIPSLSAFAQSTLPVNWVTSSVSKVTTATYSKDGTMMAVAGQNGIQVFSVASQQIIRCLPSAAIAGVGPIAFSPDGKSLADGGTTGSGQAVLEVWNIESGQQTASLPTKSVGNIAGVGFSTDGKTLIDLGGAIQTAGAFELWDLATSTLIGSPMTDIHNPACMAISPDGRTVALGGFDGMGDGTVELWDITTQTQTAGFVTSVNLATSALAFSADGTKLAYGSEVAQFDLGTSQGILGIWNVTTSTNLRTFPTAASTFVTSVSISPDGTKLVDTFNTNQIEIWNIANGSAITSLNSRLQGVNVVQFSPDGKTLLDGGFTNVASSTNSGQLGVLEERTTSDWSIQQLIITNPLQTVGAFAQSPDGVTVAGSGPSTSLSAGRFGFISIWNTTTAQLTASLSSAATYGISSMAFSPLGSLLADGGQAQSSGVVELWNFPSGSRYATLPTSASAGVTGIAFSPDGSTLATAGTHTVGGIVELWSVSSKKLIRTLMTSENIHIYSVAFSPDGTLLEVGGTGMVNSTVTGYVELWNVSTGTLVSKLTSANLTGIYSAAFSPDGTTIVAAGISGTSTTDTVGVVPEWEVSSGALVALLPLAAKTLSATSASFTKDGGHLFVGTSNGIQVIDLGTQTLATVYSGGFLSYSSANYASVSPDGTKIGYSNPNLAFIAVSPNPFFVPAVKSLIFNPISVQGGTSSTGTVTLALPAPSAGATIPLTSNIATAMPPASVSIPAGSTVGTFTVATTGVNAQASATITAGSGATAKTANLTILPPKLSTLTLNPTSVYGGATVTGTLTISGPAGPGGLSIEVSSDLSSGMTPNSVTVPEGKTSATFSVTTFPVSSQSTATILAALGTANLSATLTVLPAALSALSLSPASVPGGYQSTGTVALTSAAGPSGLMVNLSSNSPFSLVPASVNIASGKSSATFNITTKTVSKPVLSTIMATSGSVATTAVLTIDVITPTSVTLSPATVFGGTSSVGSVTLTGPAPKGGFVVKLKSSSPSAVVPSTVTVVGGKASATFTIRTSAVAVQKSVAIAATLNGGLASGTLTINSPSLMSLSLAPSTVAGGTSSVGTVKLSSPAPLGGLKITLTTNTPSASVLTTLVVSSRRTSASFVVKTIPVATVTKSLVTANLGGTAQSATLTITPPVVKLISLSPAKVNGGKFATGTVSISSIAPIGGLVISLASSSSFATVPGSITIPAGKTVSTFKIQTSIPQSKTTATISAKTVGDAGKSAVLTII